MNNEWGFFLAAWWKPIFHRGFHSCPFVAHLQSVPKTWDY
jgi:hypothetical protein